MTKEKSSIKEHSRTGFNEPHLYRVTMFNDDFTTMDFVVEVLTQVFGKSNDEAQTLMLTVHQKGKAVVGIYSLDIAMTKAAIATQMARQNKFPLKFEIDKE